MQRAFVLLFALTLLGCSAPKKDPAPFGREVVAAVAAGDFDRYLALSSQRMEALAGSDSRIPGQGLGSVLAPHERQRARDEFDRILRTGRIRPGDAERLQPVVVASELERWTLELFDPSGQGVGIQMAVHSWNDSYRVLRLYPVAPGRAQDSVVGVGD